MKAAKPEPYKVTWEKALFRQSRLPLPCIAVLAALASYGSGEGGRIFPTQDTLAEGLGVDRKTVGAWLKRGREAGWITRVRTASLGRGSDAYTLTIPRDIDVSIAGHPVGSGTDIGVPVAGHPVGVDLPSKNTREEHTGKNSLEEHTVKNGPVSSGDVEAVLESIEAAPDLDSLQPIWATNQSAFSDPDVMAAYKARGKALKAAQQATR